MPNANNKRPLKNLTADDLRPLWSRLDIRTENIAKALGVTRAAISYKAKTLGLPPRTGNQECAKLLPDAVFKRMWVAGVSVYDMAKAGGYSHPGAISHRRKVLGLKARTRSTGGNNRSSWNETIPIEKFQEIELARLMGKASKKEVVKCRV